MGSILRAPMKDLLITVLAAAATCIFGMAGECRVGVAATDITPPMGIPMAGYYHERGADGILDPLYSKAMVIEQDGERAALVILDLIGITRWVTDEARQRIEASTGIRRDHVMISATHAHTGPELSSACCTIERILNTVKARPSSPMRSWR